MSKTMERADLKHRAGCPATRTETFTSSRSLIHPNQLPDLGQPFPTVPVQVTRCIECGAQTVVDGERIDRS